MGTCESFGEYIGHEVKEEGEGLHPLCFDRHGNRFCDLRLQRWSKHSAINRTADIGGEWDLAKGEQDMGRRRQGAEKG